MGKHINAGEVANAKHCTELKGIVSFLPSSVMRDAVLRLGELICGFWFFALDRAECSKNLHELSFW
jgi:hypothetical protein